MVAVKGQNVYDPAFFARVTRLTQRLSRIPGVLRVISLSTIKSDMDLLNEWSLADFEKVMEPIELFKKNVVSIDKKTTAITIILKDIRQEESIVSAIDGILKKESGPYKTYQIGMPQVSQALLKSIKKDFTALPVIAFLVMVATLAYLFRSVTLVIPTIVVVMSTLLWTFGVMTWTDIPVSATSMVVPVYLIGVGSAYCLHVIAEYAGQAGRSGMLAEASYNASRLTRLPTLLIVLSDLIGILSLVFNPTKGIREFAVPTFVGTLSLLLLMFFLLPAVPLLFPRPKEPVHKQKVDVAGRFLHLVIRWNQDHHKAVLAVVAVITLIFGAGILRLRIDANPADYFRKDSEISKNFHDIYKNMAGCYPVNIVVDGHREGYFQDVKNLAKICDLQKYLESVSGIDKTMSFADYTKLINYSMNNHTKEFYALPQEQEAMSNILNLSKMILPADISSRFIRPDFSKLNIVMMTHIASTHDWLQAEKQIEDWCRTHYAEDFSVTMTSMGVTLAHSNEIYAWSSVSSLFACLGVIFLIMLVLFLSFKMACVAVLPSIFPMVVLYGFMGWTRTELSFSTGMIACIATGLTVDGTFHYIVSYNRRYREDLNEKSALAETILEDGRPMLYYTLTLCLGFSVLLLSSFMPTSAFGGLIILSVLSALVGNIIILPGLVQQVHTVTFLDLARMKLGESMEKGIPLFSGFSPMQIRAVLMTGAIQDYPPGHIFSMEARDDESVFVVLTGQVSIFHAIGTRDKKESSASARIRIGTLRAGDVFGVRSKAAWWHGEKAVLMSTVKTELLEINPKTIRRLQWFYPPASSKFIYNLISVLSQQVEKTTQALTGTSNRDDIAGMTNPTTFNHALKNEMLRMDRYGGSLAVAMVEIQNFQDVIAGNGAAATEPWVSRMMEIMETQIREYDTLCRVDDHRFALLLVQSGPSEAQSTCTRLEELWEKEGNKEGLEPLFIRVSYSVYVPGSGQRGQDLIKEALEALPAAS